MEIRLEKIFYHKFDSKIHYWGSTQDNKVFSLNNYPGLLNITKTLPRFKQNPNSILYFIDLRQNNICIPRRKLVRITFSKLGLT